MNPPASNKRMASNASSMNFGTKTRAKFVKSHGHGFSSPTSISSPSIQNKTLTNNVSVDLRFILKYNLVWNWIV